MLHMTCRCAPLIDFGSVESVPYDTPRHFTESSTGKAAKDAHRLCLPLMTAPHFSGQSLRPFVFAELLTDWTSLGTRPSHAEKEGLVNLHTYKFEVRGISAG